MVLKLGINEWPMPGRIVKRATYERRISRIDQERRRTLRSLCDLERHVFRGIYHPGNRRVRLTTLVHLGRPGSPIRRSSRLRPNQITFSCGSMLCSHFFLHRWRRHFFSSARPWRSLALILLPFLSGEGEKSWKRRPIAVLTVLLIAITLGTFTRMAQFAPWSPHMNAWSGDPVPDRFVHGTTALERQGALVFQVKQCRNCHSLGDTGGKRGPALDSVAVRLTQDQLIRQVIQGGGNMPAYGNNLSPAETTALVAFLETLHPAGQAPRAMRHGTLCLAKAVKSKPALSDRTSHATHSSRRGRITLGFCAFDSRRVSLRAWMGSHSQA